MVCRKGNEQSINFFLSKHGLLRLRERRNQDDRSWMMQDTREITKSDVRYRGIICT